MGISKNFDTFTLHNALNLPLSSLVVNFHGLSKNVDQNLCTTLAYSQKILSTILQSFGNVDDRLLSRFLFITLSSTVLTVAASLE